jgi:Zinc dependent phospholipase C
VRGRKHRLLAAVVFVVLLCPGARRAPAYSLLTHEQLIDLTWDDSIVPLLLSRFPNLTPAQLDHARAYAYGGCVIQDIGYYPYGQMFLSNLTHYVRSGDFVVNLFRDARNADELAFAVGALSHYVGDSYGHSMATNRAVPVEFPKLGRKYGKVVSFADGEDEHVRTEFAFDIDEIAHRRMAPARYLRHIGLQVPTRQLSEAFYQTYGLSEKFSGIRRLHINESEYRFAVHTFIPRIAYAVTLLHRSKEPDDPTDAKIVALHQEINAMAIRNEWDKYRRKAGIGTYMLAGLLFILPKFGPLKLAAVKGPTVQTDAEYDHSLITSVAAMRGMLARFTPPASRRTRAPRSSANQAEGEHLPAPPPRAPVAPGKTDVPADSRDPRHPLQNRDLDTGYVVKPGGYRLTDATFAELLHVLTRHPSQPVPPGVKRAIEEFYADLNMPITTKKNAEKWQQVLADLASLKTMPTNPEPQPFTTYDDEEQD